MLLHLSRQGLGSGEVDDGEVIFMPAARARKITHPCEPAHGAAQKLPLSHTSLEARRIIYHASYTWRQELYIYFVYSNLTPVSASCLSVLK